jgi:hypothetical protein
MVVVVIVIFVAILSHLVPILIVVVAISISIACPCDVVGRTPIVAVMIVSPAIVSVMVIPDDAIAEARIVVKARIIAETRFVLASPLQILPLALTAQPVVFDIVVPAFDKPLAVVWIVLSIVAPVAGIGAALIPMLCASGRHDCSQSQS